MATAYKRITVQCKYEGCKTRVRNDNEFCATHLKVPFVPDSRTIEPNFTGKWYKGPGGVRYPVFDRSN